MEFANCNICGCANFKEISAIKISPTLTPSKLVRCSRCGFFYANPRLSKEAEEKHYKEVYHEKEPVNYWFEGRLALFKRALNLIEKFMHSGNLLDVGCGMGFFMDLARTRGWGVKGIEMSDFAVSHAREKLGLDVINAEPKGANLQAEYYDVITMWNVLDQIYDPKNTLLELNRFLKKGGYVFLRVSNLSFHISLSRLYKVFSFLSKDADIFPVFHLYSFDKNSLRRLFKETGFSVVAINPDSMEANNSYLIKLFGKRTEVVLRKVTDFISGSLYLLSLGRIVLSPSIIAIARKL
jgi:ubiquinone/menaquinone biosynthesis C-methylase UbiE